MELEIKFSYDEGEVEVEWDVEEEFFRALDTDAKFNALLNALGERFRDVVEASDEATSDD